MNQAYVFQQPSSQSSLQNSPRSMSDSALITYTQRLAKQERELLTKVLHYLYEIDRRKLFSSFKCPSLFEFAVKHLGYSDDQACRRIAAMRLMQQISEVEGQLESGELNLSHVSVLSTYFNQEAKFLGAPLSIEKKKEVIDMIAGTSIRRAQQIIRGQSSNPACLSTDQIKLITGTHVEIKFTAPKEIIEQIEILKGLLAHKHPNITLGELFGRLCELGITEWNPSKSVRMPKVCTQSNKPSKDKNPCNAPAERNLCGKPDRGLKSTPVSQNQDGTPLGVPSLIPNSRSRYISAISRREVYKRAENKCEHCSSKFALQVDHKFPFAKGGKSELENLRLLCRSCNQRAAIKHYGVEKMSRHLERT